MHWYSTTERIYLKKSNGLLNNGTDILHEYTDRRAFIPGTDIRFYVHSYTQDESATCLTWIYEHNLTVVNAFNLWQEKFFFLVVIWQNDLQTGKHPAFLLSIEKHCWNTYNWVCTAVWN